MRPYEIMVILDPTLDERTVAPSLEAFLNVVRKDGGTVEKIDIWGKRRLAYEIAKHAEGIYVVVDLKAEPATVSELDRQLSLNESATMRPRNRMRWGSPRSRGRAGQSGADPATRCQRRCVGSARTFMTIPRTKARNRAEQGGNRGW
jgi:small subunit ribosomal protein S6